MIVALILPVVRPAMTGEPGAAAVAQSPVPDSADGEAFAVARMVRGILSYVRWPDDSSTIRLCVAGDPRFAGRLGGMDTASGRQILPHSLAAGETPADAGCDALYLGRMSPAARARLIGAAHDQPIVTIDEADPSRRAGAMFCLSVDPARISFQLDLDAVSRSRVRIDPKVLLLSRSREPGT